MRKRAVAKIRTAKWTIQQRENHHKKSIGSTLHDECRKKKSPDKIYINSFSQ